MIVPSPTSMLPVSPFHRAYAGAVKLGFALMVAAIIAIGAYAVLSPSEDLGTRLPQMCGAIPCSQR